MAAVATYYGLGKKVKKPELEAGRENIRDLVTMFRAHAIGSENDMHLNHVGFQRLCHELRLGSHDLSNRLFAGKFILQLLETHGDVLRQIDCLFDCSDGCRQHGRGGRARVLEGRALHARALDRPEGPRRVRVQP